jgi:hypothetical protein
MGLNEDATQLTLNQGTRNNIRRKVPTAAIDGKSKRTCCKYCRRADHKNFCKKCPYHDGYVFQPGNDLALVTGMKSIYPKGMHLNQVVEVEEMNCVDTTVDEERELITGKCVKKSVRQGKM